MLPLADVGRRSDEILAQVERAVIGKREVLELVLLGILANGHILLEDVPGLAKTLLARSFAAATSLHFQRIQFTPDLMPSDVTGSSSSTSAPRTSASAPARSSRTFSSPTRSTAPRRRRRRRCSRRCRRTR